MAKKTAKELIELLSDKNIDRFIAKLCSPKRREEYLKTLCDCFTFLSEYMVPLSRNFPGIYGVYTNIRTKIEGKHHLPPEGVINELAINIKEYLEYLKENRHDIIDMLR